MPTQRQVIRKVIAEDGQGVSPPSTSSSRDRSAHVSIPAIFQKTLGAECEAVGRLSGPSGSKRCALGSARLIGLSDRNRFLPDVEEQRLSVRRAMTAAPVRIVRTTVQSEVGRSGRIVREDAARRLSVRL
ncbi:MAG: hypothetical protein MZU97_10385 [Bacillus subtilis]|nr:hypothetical protein [Bacillus subtilis]